MSAMALLPLWQAMSSPTPSTALDATTMRAADTRIGGLTTQSRSSKSELTASLNNTRTFRFKTPRASHCMSMVALRWARTLLMQVVFLRRSRLGNNTRNPTQLTKTFLDLITSATSSCSSFSMPIVSFIIQISRFSLLSNNYPSLVWKDPNAAGSSVHLHRSALPSICSHSGHYCELEGVPRGL